MRISRTSTLDLIVYVDPVKYYELPYKDKDLVAKLIGKINWHYRDLEKHMMLIVHSFHLTYGLSGWSVVE